MASSTSAVPTRRLVGYFPAWGIHAMQFRVSAIPADQLTHVIYAFAGVSASGDCVSINAADDSVNFPQLARLKRDHPMLSVLISVGGAANSTGFARVAAEEKTRQQFASSCIAFMLQHGFDGVDIDWEYPGAEERQNYTALLRELRNQLEAEGARNNRQYVLTIAAPAGASHYTALELNLIHPLVDWINLMAYDFTLASSTETDFVAPLMPYDETLVAKHATSNVDSAVQAYVQASVPPGKVVLGTCLIGTGWAGVPGMNNGLYQASAGPAQGSWDEPGKPPTGSFGYQDLKQHYIGAYPRYWHAAAQVPWLYQPTPSGAPGVMISYEDPQSLKAKANYVLAKGLGGVMIWPLSADDDQHSLVHALADVLGGQVPVSGSDTYMVTGTVTRSDGTPARGLTVSAFDQDMRKRQLLGRGRTGADGGYQITYPVSAFGQAEAGGPDLVVEVYDQNEEVLATASVLFNAPRLATVNITLAHDGSEAEYDRIARILMPLMDGQGVTLETLEENNQYHDLTFAAGETGLPIDKLTAFAVARRLSSRTQLSGEFWFAVVATNTISLPKPTQSSPGMDVLAEGVLAAVPDTPITSIQPGLNKAVTNNLIVQPSADQNQIWLRQYSDLMVSEAMKPGSTSGAGAILDASGLPQDKRKLLLAAYLGGGTRDDILQRVHNTRQFTDQEINAIAATLAVRDLTFSDEKLLASFGKTIKDPSALPSLARFSTADWQAAITQSGATPPGFIAGNTPAEQTANYAALLARRAAMTYPTAAFAGDLSRAIASQAAGAFKSASTMLEFFDAHPEFELATTSIDGFFKNNASPKLLSAASSDTQFLQDLKSAQRIFKLAPNFAASDRLLQDGIHSAQQIYKLGEAQFVQKYGNQPGFCVSAAQDIYQRAANTHAAVLTLVGQLRATQSANQIQGLANPVSALDNFPNLKNLFGNLDTCDCDECQSIFSPAAYLADLLHYLEGRLTPTGTVEDMLTRRRPDIGYIELSCENSETPLPYIDLACEVMEDRVAPWTLLTLPVALLPDLVEGAADANLITAFATANPLIRLSPSARVSAKDALGNWVIHDTAQTYLIQQQAAGLVVSILRQTHLTEEELAAYPEYVNDAAYDVLRVAPYPMALPFDLSTEEVRAYLTRMNVQRATLMDVFRGPNAPNNPQDLNIAAEYVNITSFEQTLIFQADPANQFNYWGAADNNSAIAQMSHVDAFLAATGLAFPDLEKLLSLSFVNPGGSIVIQNLDFSCDLTQKRLQVLDANALDRFHRFLRLCRKLGWQMWEVDLVIGHPALGNGALDANFALKLYPFLRIKDKLGRLSVEQLCAFWGTINTTAKFTAAYQKPDPSLYETLFLNKRLTNPLDPAFAIAAVTTPSDTITNHIPPILAATRVKQTDLTLLADLTQPANGPAYIDDQLSLQNLSFLYRHALLAKTLGIKISDWALLLFLMQEDVFKDPATTWAFLTLWDRIQTSTFSIDQLDYVLTANLGARSAAAEKTITPVLSALQKSLQGIAANADPATIPQTVDGLTNAIGTQLQTLGWDSASVTSLLGVFSNQIQLQRIVQGPPAGFSFPSAITSQMPIGFDPKTNAIRFTGVMTAAQKNTLLTDPSLAAITSDPSYQRAVGDLYDTPGLLIKFYRPLFAAPLVALPNNVQFSSLPAALAAKISYDTGLGQLTFMGMMNTDEQDAITALSADADYRAAVLSLFNQPRTATGPATELWLKLTDLAMPLESNLVRNLTLAELGSATVGGLNAFVVHKLSTDQVIQQIAAALGLTQAIASYFLTRFPRFGTIPNNHALLADFLDPTFVNASSALAFDAFPEIYQGYYWLHRLALIVKTLAMTYSDLQWTVNDQPQTGVIDMTALPLANSPTLIPSPLTALIDLADLLRLHHAMLQDDLKLLDIIDTLIHPPNGGYTNAQFSADLETLTEWTASDIVWLTTAGNSVKTFPAAYEKVDGWLWIAQAFTIIQQLNATAPSAAALANPTLSAADSSSLKHMLGAKFDEATYLSLSKPIQDALRERKRDSLVAYLLSQPMPADNPTGKWTDPEDLFAYYLIDVEMSSCQPSSRVVQASAAVQLLVQRCFMGLEPQVRVSVDDDSGWNDWSWMKYYRVWEANRRVFAYPENYCEPELRKDKSEIFSALQNDLQQNEITRDNVETAFEHYLDALDAVSRLEISGMYYQESNQTLHVFGNTSGNPPLYYYRQFIAGRRWTAWSKVDCDIKANYVVPLVNNDRLYIVWPEFQSEASPPTTFTVPQPGDGSSAVDAPKKYRLMHLAVSEFKSHTWTPKKVSLDAVDVGLCTDDDFNPDSYFILPIDLTWLPDRLFPDPKTKPVKMPPGYEWLLEGPFLLQVMLRDQTSGAIPLATMFELAGCKGAPEVFQGTLALQPILTRFARDEFSDGHNTELSSDPSDDDLEPVVSGSPVPTLEILGNTPGLFEICYPHYLSYFDRFGLVTPPIPASSTRAFRPYALVGREGIPVTLGTFFDWFYADKLRTFFVRPELFSRRTQSALYYEDVVALIQELTLLIADKNYLEFFKVLMQFIRSDYRYALHFFTAFHPLVCHFARSLYARDVEGLLARETQFADGGLNFAGLYEPTALVDPDHPQEVVDFDPIASYSLYNWELFYFAPMYVAEQLLQNQQFDEALRWCHFVFDPTGSHDRDPLTGNPAPAPQKYWITKPFYLRQQTGPNGYLAQSLDDLMNMLASDPTNLSANPQVLALQKQVADWRKNPFDPHVVAQYRTVAYQKFAVMKCLDILIAGGDNYFRMDTLESVNLATQYYVCAAEILGARPEKVPPPEKPLPLTFHELDPQLDAFSNALVTFENLIPAMPTGNGYGPPPPPLPGMLYFCIPQNEQLLSYWNTVEDRLYKIRHCLNIEGVFNPPALFAPPINPMALVAATAAGLDISSALADLDVPLPYYRFTTMLQKANEFTNDVKSLGASLLAALEKNDAEGLALLRQTQEISLLQAARDIKQMQIDDAQLVIDGLQKNKELIIIRRDYYASRDFMNAGEITAMTLSGAALASQLAGTVADVLAGVMFLIPDFHAGASGFGGSPHVTVQEGGDNAGQSATRGANGLYQISAMLDKSASIAATLAGYRRRMDDWQNQINLANKELEQLDKQIAAAQKKLDIANQDLANHDLQITHSQAVNQFMLSKYTNQDLYQWMISQISQTYFQSYQLAYDMAKRAERCYRFELGLADSSIIQFGYWDSLKKGLHAGERLQLDLRRLESAYLNQNMREFECTKHISLALLNPNALITLRDQGICTFSLPEELFDLDFPGHYFRRLKSVSVSIPCVAGPYTTVSSTLRLVKNMVRINSQPGSQYAHNQDDSGVFTDDDRFLESRIRVNAIATSSAQNDSGMFELNFRDERYLPFEGAGAIGSWQLELTQEPQLRQFNYDTISDVILHVRYTSREDAGAFRSAVISHLKDDVLTQVSPQMPLLRLFDLMHEFPTGWSAFLHPLAGQQQTLRLNITGQHFPFLAQGRPIQIEGFSLFIRTRPSITSLAAQVDPTTGGGSVYQMNFGPADPNGFFKAEQNGGLGIVFDPTQPWIVQIGTKQGQFNSLNEGDILDCYLVAQYTLQ